MIGWTRSGMIDAARLAGKLYLSGVLIPARKRHLRPLFRKLDNDDDHSVHLAHSLRRHSRLFAIVRKTC